MALPYRTTGSLRPAFASARLVGLAVNLVYAFALVGLISKQPEPSFSRLRYRFGGDRPSQTTRLPFSLSRITGVSYNHRTISVVSHRWLHRFRATDLKACHLSCADGPI